MCPNQHNTLLAGTVEFTDCTKPSDGEAPVMELWEI